MDVSRISTCSIALIHHPPEEAMRIIAEAGFEKVDLLEKLPHLSVLPYECDPATLKAAADKHGLQIANLATYVGGGQDGRRTAWSFHGWEVPRPERFTNYGFSSDDIGELATEYQQLCRAVDLAVYFGARTVRVVAGNDKPETLDKVVPWFQKSAAYAEKNNVYLTLENHSAGIAGTPELCRELAEKVGSAHFGILYEPHNLMTDTGTDYRQALEVMKNHITHVHFKDGEPTDQGYGLTLMGEGEIDFPWIMSVLDEVGYDGDIALEYELHPPAPSAEEGLAGYYEGFVKLFK